MRVDEDEAVAPGTPAASHVAPRTGAADFLLAAAPDPWMCRVARIVIALAAIGFAVVAPFANVHLARLPSFIPSYEAALAIVDLVTAILLFSQFSILRRRSVLAIACAYAFSATLAAAHALSFPNAGPATGLFGDTQTTGWLYVSWHAGFPLLVAVYALLADTPSDTLRPTASAARTLGFALLVLGGCVAAIVALASRAERVLPILIVGSDFSPMVHKGISPLVLVECAVVIALLWKRRHRSVLDVWLFAVLWVWICDVALSAVIGSVRFDLGWYSGRIFGLVAASLVLAALLVELDVLYARIATTLGELQARNEELVRSRDVIARTQRFEALGQLTGGIAHDFNNILAAITGSLEMVGRRADDAERVRRLAANATRAADRGAELIRRLMSFARKHNLQPEVLDTDAVLREFAGLAGNLPATNVTLRLDLGDAGAVRVDETEFQAAFLNLVGNARDAMTGGGEIVVSSRRRVLGEADLVVPDLAPGPYVEIAIVDRGGGIPRELQPRIFEPFFTTKPPGTGTGLGLSQVYGFVHSADGQVVVESALGFGTTIRLHLPAAAARPAVATTPAAGPQAPDRRAAGRSVLLVDDDRDVLVATKDRVEDLGFSVVTATSGDEALGLIAQGLVVDVVFSDVVMPGRLDGVALAEAVRRLRPTQGLVLTSGYTGSERERLQLPENLPFLAKPYSREELADTLAVAVASAVAETGR